MLVSKVRGVQVRLRSGEVFFFFFFHRVTLERISYLSRNHLQAPRKKKGEVVNARIHLLLAVLLRLGCAFSDHATIRHDIPCCFDPLHCLSTFGRLVLRKIFCNVKTNRKYPMTSMWTEQLVHTYGPHHKVKTIHRVLRSFSIWLYEFGMNQLAKHGEAMKMQPMKKKMCTNENV